MTVGALITLTALVPAFIFVLAGVAKLSEPTLAATFVSNALSVPFSFALQIIRVASALEIIVGVALCVLLTRSALPAVAALCIVGFFLGLLLRLELSYPRITACGCFGSLMGVGLQRAPGIQIMMDVGLASLLGAHLLLFRISRKRHARVPPSSSDQPAIANREQGQTPPDCDAPPARPAA
jgi:hypothetical protein